MDGYKPEARAYSNDAFRDGVLAAIKQVEEMNILSPNNDEPMYFSDFFGQSIKRQPNL